MKQSTRPLPYPGTENSCHAIRGAARAEALRKKTDHGIGNHGALPDRDRQSGADNRQKRAGGEIVDLLLLMSGGGRALHVPL